MCGSSQTRPRRSRSHTHTHTATNPAHTHTHTHTRARTYLHKELDVRLVVVMTQAKQLGYAVEDTPDDVRRPALSAQQPTKRVNGSGVHKVSR